MLLGTVNKLQHCVFLESSSSTLLSSTARDEARGFYCLMGRMEEEASCTSIWFCCDVFTSHSVGTWFRLSVGKKSFGSAMSERESAGDEKRELLLESSSRYEAS